MTAITKKNSKIKNLKGKEVRKMPLHAEDGKTFQKGILSTKVKHKRDVEWIDKAKEKMLSEKWNSVIISKDGVKRKLK